MAVLGWTPQTKKSYMTDEDKKSVMRSAASASGIGENAWTKSKYLNKPASTSLSMVKVPINSNKGVQQRWADSRPGATWLNSPRLNPGRDTVGMPGREAREGERWNSTTRSWEKSSRAPQKVRSKQVYDPVAKKWVDESKVKKSPPRRFSHE